MDHPETDRVVARELDGVIQKLRADLQKEKDANTARSANMGWIVALIVLLVLCFVVCGDSGHRHSIY